MHNIVKRQAQLLEEAGSSWRPRNNININQNNYGEDSLEIAPVDDEIFDQSDLAERILDAEKKFSTSSIHTSHFASEYFEHPALYRVLFMGSVTEEKKKELFKKLSQGFVHVLQQQPHYLRNTNNAKNLSLLGQPIIPFKEIKHNILLLSDDDDPNLTSDICEDIGVSMIEADFTWNSNAVNYSNDPNNLLLQYAWNQCPNPRELPSAWLENQIFKSKFTGYMHPETTPNGIDLCVYFYDGPIDEDRTKDDLELLCLLRKLGIYVLPLTTTRDESVKSHFADLLTEYKVRCLDLGNLEVGQEPSFFHKTPATVVTTSPTALPINTPTRLQQQVDRLSRLQGMECTQSNVPRVATYQILAVDQFCGIENNAIFQLLKRTRERQVMRDEMKVELLQRQKIQQQQNADDDTAEDDDDNITENSLDSITSRSASTFNLLDSKKFSIRGYSNSRSNIDDNETLSNSRARLISIPIFLFIVLSVVGVRYFNGTIHISSPPVQHWTASFDVDLSQDVSFTLSTRDNQGNLKWPNKAPQVWLNHARPIPIERVSNSPGQYQLVFDTTIPPPDSSEKFISLVFHVNTTTSANQSSSLINDDQPHIIYTNTNPSSATYLLLNSRYNMHNKATFGEDKAARPQYDKKKKVISTPMLDEQITTASNFKHNSMNDDDSTSIFRKTWKTFVFITNNYSNLYKIIIKN